MFYYKMYEFIRFFLERFPPRDLQHTSIASMALDLFLASRNNRVAYYSAAGVFWRGGVGGGRWRLHGLLLSRVSTAMCSDFERDGIRPRSDDLDLVFW
jgi:hypothetical protein